MRFSEFAPGMVITAGPYEVSEAEVLQFAKAWDPQWLHTNPVAAMNSRFGGLIASGWHTCGIAMRLMADKALQGSESFAWPGLAWPTSSGHTKIGVRAAMEKRAPHYAL
jgi:acyl dehydratase